MGWNRPETKQFAKQTSGPWKTLFNIMNDLFYTKICKIWCFGGQKAHLNKNQYNNWVLSTQHAEYSVSIWQLCDKQQLKQSWVVITQNDKNTRLKAEIGLFLKKCNRSRNWEKTRSAIKSMYELVDQTNDLTHLC